MAVDSARNTALADSPIDEPTVPAVRTTAAALSQDLPTAQIRPSPTNPRTLFDEEAMAALTASVTEHGILEPIVVRRRPDATTTYELIAGERRWRAAQAAGLRTIPCRVANGIDDRQALELQALENLQRADLNPVEEAQTFRQLADAGLKQTAIARTVGKSQPYVANRLRILDLPSDTLDHIRTGQLSAAHGVALARFAPFPAIASKLASLAVEHNWPAREIEKGMPAQYELASAGLIRVLHSGSGVDVTACQECPFQAFRRPNEYGPGICLRPDHYAELKAAAERRGQEAISQLAVQQHASADAPDEAPTLPSIRDLDYNAIRVIRSDPPTGCTGGCPCRAVVLGLDDNPTPICTSPSRFDQLEKTRSKADAKVRRDQYKALATRVDDHLAEVVTFGRKELAIIGAELSTRVGAEVLRNAVKRWLPPISDNSGKLERVTRDQLLSAHPHELLRFCLALKLGDELTRTQQYGYAPDRCDIAHWYLADGSSSAEVSPDAPPPDTDDEYPRASDLTCASCGQPIIVQSAADDRKLAYIHTETPFPTVCLRDCPSIQAATP